MLLNQHIVATQNPKSVGTCGVASLVSNMNKNWTDWSFATAVWGFHATGEPKSAQKTQKILLSLICRSIRVGFAQVQPRCTTALMVHVTRTNIKSSTGYVRRLFSPFNADVNVA
jgi:hypothetical protein